jgi:predicted nuclease with TOPRIM domain
MDKDIDKLVAEIEALRATIAKMEQEKQELTNVNTRMYDYCRKMDRQFSQAVKRELSYREMLFVFNHAQTSELLKEFIGRDGMRIQYSANYNFRSN